MTTVSKLKTTETAVLTEMALSFNGVDLRVYWADGAFWITKGQLQDALGGLCPNDGFYYLRRHGLFSSRILFVDGVPRRAFTLAGAQWQAQRMPSAPMAAEFVAWVKGLQQDDHPATCWTSMEAAP